ncbi:MAG TPA: acyl-CoA dehydrogenase family protein, partial [Candidatus Polarisedimenticolia bacterium]|nr:acyl-CoA dehydrogenase family protein [Candidatus Polarisedimenticolia bacterium]
MDFQLTREQEMLRETVRAFAEDVLKPRAGAFDRSREFPLDNYRRCAELGLCGMMVPEAYGGAG